MNKTAALYNFFSGFGISAYPVTSVPDNISFPWLTYEVATDDWGGSPVSIVCTLWYHTESESEPNAKAKEISDYIGLGGCIVTCDEGAIWIKKGSPVCRSITDSADPTVKGRSMNLTLEYLTL